jgi:hypothetical protein
VSDRPPRTKRLENACELTTARLNHVPIPSSTSGGRVTVRRPAALLRSLRAPGRPTTGQAV